MKIKLLKLKLLFIISLILFLFFFGLLLNQIAITFNNYKMPVKTYLNVENPKTHFPYTNNNEINFPILADNYRINPFNNKVLYSIGDIYIIISSVLLIYLIMVFSQIKINALIENHRVNKINKILLPKNDKL